MKLWNRKTITKIVPYCKIILFQKQSLFCTRKVALKFHGSNCLCAPDKRESLGKFSQTRWNINLFRLQMHVYGCCLLKCHKSTENWKFINRKIFYEFPWFSSDDKNVFFILEDFLWVKNKIEKCWEKLKTISYICAYRI